MKCSIKKTFINESVNERAIGARSIALAFAIFVLSFIKEAALEEDVRLIYSTKGVELKQEIAD